MNNRLSMKNILLFSSILSVGFSIPNRSNAAFEWTPPAKQIEKSAEAETDPSMVPAPVTDIQVEDTLSATPPPPQPLQSQTTPIEHLEQKAPQQMTMTTPQSDSQVVEELKSIVHQAHENNVITPIAPIPQAEKIDIPVPEAAPIPVPEAVSIPEAAPIVVPEPTQLVIEAPAAQDIAVETKASLDVPAAPDVINGFGKDLPLITAIRQIVPVGTAYSFGENVDLATPVSWDSGKSWLDTIQKIADANDLIVVETQEKILLTKEVVPPPVKVAIVEENVAVDEPAAVTDSSPETQIEIAAQPTPPMPEVESFEDDGVIEATLSDVVIIPPIDETLSVIAKEDTPNSFPNMETGAIVAPLDIAETSFENTDNTPEVMAEISPITENIEVVAIAEEPQATLEKKMPRVELPEPVIEDVQTEIQANIKPVELSEPAIEDAQAEIQAEIKPIELPKPVIEDVQTEIIQASIEPVELPEPVIEDIQTEMQANIVHIDPPEPDTNINAAGIDVEKANALAEKMRLESTPVEITENSQESFVQEDSIQDVIITEPTKEVMPLGIGVAENVIEATEEQIAMAPTSLSSVEASQESMASSAMPSIVSDEVKTWKVKKNADLKKTLEAWSAESGVELQWNLPEDYTIGYMVWVEGNFEEAVDTLMQGYNNQQGIVPSASIQADSSGKPVLIVDPAA